jgi:hypothetical protein
MGIIQVAMELDPRAMYDLIEARVPCNAALAKHPTIQVTKDGKVGFVGLLNGILAKSGVKLTVGVTHAEMTMDYLRIDGDDGSFSEYYRRDYEPYVAGDGQSDGSGAGDGSTGQAGA